MSKLIHLTRPGLAGALGPKAYGPEGPVHDLIRCARDDDDKDVYAGSGALPSAPQFPASVSPRQVKKLIQDVGDGVADPKDFIGLGAAAVPFLIDACRRSDVPEAVAELLREITDPEAVRPLLMALEDQSFAQRYHAIAGLGNIGDPIAVDPLIGFLDHPDLDLRSAAVMALGELRDSRATEFLCQALHDEESEVVEGAFESLALICDARSVVPILQGMADRRIESFQGASAIQDIVRKNRGAIAILLDQLEQVENTKVRFSASSAISVLARKEYEELRSDRAVSIFIAALENGENGVIMDVVCALCESGDDRVWEVVTPLLAHSDRYVRQVAVRELFDLDRTCAVQAIVGLTISEDPDVAAHMEEELISLREYASMGPVADALRRSDGESFEVLSDILFEMGSHQGGPGSMRDAFFDITLKDPDPRIRALGMSKLSDEDPHVFEKLSPLVDDPDENVRAEAVRMKSRIEEVHARNARQAEEWQRQAAERQREEDARREQEAAEAAAQAAIDAKLQAVHARIEAVTKGVIASLSEMLGLQYNLRTSVTASEYVQGRVVAFDEDRTSFAPGSGLTMRILPEVTIEAGPTAEYAREVLKVLNFLVHHELAHAVQVQRELEQPEVDLAKYSHLDHKLIAHYANETLMDKMAFEMGTNLYVHGDGDVVFDCEIREIIVIGAMLALAGLFNNDLDEGRRTFDAPQSARHIAILREAAMSRVITRKMQLRVRGQANAFYDRAVGEMGADEMKEFDRLIDEYRRIFRTSSLEV